MADQLVPADFGRSNVPVKREPEWAPPVPTAAATRPLERPIAALRRFRWAILGIVVLAAGAGLIATRFVDPKYEVRATVWVASETPLQEQSGPIRSNELLKSEAWVELLRSYRISDAVVRRLSLYLRPKNRVDKPLFAGFTIADRFVPGDYELRVDRARRRWTLTTQRGAATDSGASSDSVGYRFGLRWKLPEAAFTGGGVHKVEFTVSTPRETSVELTEHLGARLAPNSNFLWLTLQDPDPQLAAQTLNTWVNEYVTVASELKKKKLVEFAKILRGQLDYAEVSLRNAESALESFRVKTITLPSEGGPVAGGVEVTRAPALGSFLDQKIEYDNLRNDREALERVIAAATQGGGGVRYEAALLIPSVAGSTGAEALRDAFRQYYQRQAELRAARQMYTDDYPAVKSLITATQTLETQTIPTLTRQLLAQLRERETQYQGRITNAATDIQAIPTRTIEEMRLRRTVAVAEGLYTTLKGRYAEAQLAEESATPDVTVLDSAVAPLKPTKQTAPRIMAIAIVAGLIAAVALALLLDAVDRRLRYPAQADEELGLPVLCTIPKFPRGGVDARSPEQVAQLVEAFRTLRLAMTHAAAAPFAVAVSSPSTGDGKSLVAANLALSFAEAGYRTVLVDADTRRGGLHEAFGLPASPGLTEYLSGTADRSVITHHTGTAGLSFVSCGGRSRRSPELLTSPAIQDFMGELRREYDVVICDTPPLTAGVDAYAVSAAAGQVMMVLRIGHTNRRLAEAKLTMMDRLPVRVLGAVLNGVPSTGEFQYMGYRPYEAEETGAVTVAT